MFRFHKRYFCLAVLLLVVEFCIGAFAHDQIIRPYGGDFLITIFLYCLVRSGARWPAGRVLAAVLLTSYLVEISQYFHLVERLGWGHSRAAHLVLGSEFAWLDMLAYTLGAALVLAVEPRRPRLARPVPTH